MRNLAEEGEGRGLCLCSVGEEQGHGGGSILSCQKEEKMVWGSPLCPGLIFSVSVPFSHFFQP